MKMVTRAGLLVALAFVAVPAALMGSTTYYFINQNQDYSDSMEVSEDPVWVAEVLEIESDSTVSTPEGYEETDTAEIHSLGLLTPSEMNVAGPGTHRDWHEDFWGNRKWGSWIITSYVSGYQLKRVGVGSGTYRYTIPGTVAVACSTYRSSAGVWGPGWKTGGWWKVEWAKSWTYPSGSTYSWRQKGWHWWGSGGTEYTNVLTDW